MYGNFKDFDKFLRGLIAGFIIFMPLGMWKLCELITLLYKFVRK